MCSREEPAGEPGTAALPPELRDLLDRLHPSPQSIAACRRCRCKSWHRLGLPVALRPQRARAQGLQARVVRARIDGDAAKTRGPLRRVTRTSARGCRTGPGGESTVSLPAQPGRGGRNQHLALAAALELERRGLHDACLLAPALTEIDGASSDAGALVDDETCQRGRDAGCDPTVSLGGADSGTFLEAAGDLLHTGPTLTNVGDLVLGLRLRGIDDVAALIVSDRADYRQQLAHHVTLEWRDALPAEYEPATRGRLPAGFTGIAYDVVLLDHEVQDSRGLEWLEDLTDRPGFPPIVYFAPGGAGAVGDKARSVGALAVLTRTDFEHADLCGALRTALASRRNVLAETSRAARELCPPDRFGSVRIRGHRCLRRLAVGGSSSVFLAENVRTGEQRVLKIFRQVPDIVEAARRSIVSCANSISWRTCGIRTSRASSTSASRTTISTSRWNSFRAATCARACVSVSSRSRRSATCGRWRPPLGALHEVGVLHRDVKPGNLLLREDGSAAFIDFDSRASCAWKATSRASARSSARLIT